jgi:hydrogenase assembly chaperone HypC/HupF
VPSGSGSASERGGRGSADAGRPRHFGGIVKEINLAFVPEAGIDDYVLVHVGFALTVIDESEAMRVFEHLREMGELLDAEAGRTREGFV